MKAEFIVEGFHCKSCEMLVKDVCADFKEITSCNVDIKTGKVVVEHEQEFDVEKLKKEIEDLGNYKIKT